MNSYVGSKLILVEGLTGSGKSIMAHTIARQLAHNGIPATWVHEGELPHPLGIEDDPGAEGYAVYMRRQWATYVEHVAQSNQVSVVEACLFNNVFEWLFALDWDREDILGYADEMQTLLAPLNPTLVYLAQEDVDAALVRNFDRRGVGFRDYVIDYATDTAIAKHRGWTGYDGMAKFWREFVSLTDELYERYHIHKCKIDNAAGQWPDYDRQVMDCLALPFVPEPRLSQSEAIKLVGSYKDRQSDKVFTVLYEDGKLTIDLFLETRTTLVPRPNGIFETAGWHFEIRFELDAGDESTVFIIGGRDVEYLTLVGTVADKVRA
ncbi:MAG: hypothetical protein AAF639_30925 [Chloroflexota bacterium]